jgi:hypothetical protein
MQIVRRQGGVIVEQLLFGFANPASIDQQPDRDSMVANAGFAAADIGSFSN